MKTGFLKVWTENHACGVKGCESVLVLDGGMKPHRSVCGDTLSGVTEFEHTGNKIVTGCKSIPAPKSKFCADHADFESPVMSSDNVTKETRSKLRSYRKKTSSVKDIPQDNIYIIESIIDVHQKKSEDGEETYYKVKWLGFPASEASWEPESTVPKFIRDFYKDPKKVGKVLPKPKVKKTK